MSKETVAQPERAHEDEAAGETLEQPSILEEFWYFLRYEKRWWMGFIALILVALSAFIFLTENTAVMPFIYTIF